jgi:hypothetical protein
MIRVDILSIVREEFFRSFRVGVEVRRIDSGTNLFGELSFLISRNVNVGLSVVDRPRLGVFEDLEMLELERGVEVDVDVEEVRKTSVLEIVYNDEDISLASLQPRIRGERTYTLLSPKLRIPNN